MSMSKKQNNFNKTKYIFTHKTHDDEFLTQYHLRDKYGLNASSLSMLVRGKLKTLEGWRCICVYSTPENYDYVPAYRM